MNKAWDNTIYNEVAPDGKRKTWQRVSYWTSLFIFDTALYEFSLSSKSSSARNLSFQQPESSSIVPSTRPHIHSSFPIITLVQQNVFSIANYKIRKKYRWTVTSVSRTSNLHLLTRFLLKKTQFLVNATLFFCSSFHEYDVWWWVQARLYIRHLL